MNAAQIAALYAASKQPQTVVIDTSPKTQKPPETLAESRSWREALQCIKDAYRGCTPQEQAEIKALLNRVCQ